MSQPSADKHHSTQDTAAVIDSAAAQVDILLRLAAQCLRPFPPFPGAFFTEAVEVELRPTTAPAPDYGCIVVTPAGDLKELQIGLDTEAFHSLAPPDPVALRSEQLVDLDLPPADRLLYGLAALRRLAELTPRPSP